MRFTDKGIAALQAGLERYEIFDDSRTGFGLRVSTTGRKSWIQLYRVGARPRRLTLGVYPVMGLADARLASAAALKALDDGVDPGAKAAEEQLGDNETTSVAALIDEYLERWARPRKAPSSAAEDERLLNKEVRSIWGHRPAASVSKREVILLLDGIVDRGAPGTANSTLAVLRRLYNFGMERDAVTINPCAKVKAPAAKNSRERVLSEDEIRALWRGLPDPADGHMIDLACGLMSATGRRGPEVLFAEWREFDLRRGVWLIPAARAQVGETTPVLLTSLALEILDQAAVRSGSGRLVFPATQQDSPVVLMAPAIAQAIRFALVTGQRRGEIATAEWGEIDREKAIWIIPGRKTKNGSTHYVPLAPLALRLLAEMEALVGDSRWLFPSPRRDEPITPAAVSHAFRHARSALGIADATPHDLRRTAATKMAELGISQFIIGKVLNHTIRVVTAVYDRHTYVPEKRQALNLWSARLDEIVAGPATTLTEEAKAKPMLVLSAAE